MKPTIAHRSRPCEGETTCGDVAVVRAAGDSTLLAVVDVLGHGPVAAQAAQVAEDHLHGSAAPRNVQQVLEGLGDALHSHRGAAAFVCRLGGRRIEAAGVGNVEMRVFGSNFRASPTPGILGGRVRRLRVFEGELEAGSRLVLFSDGVSALFTEEAARDGGPERVCQVLIAEYGLARDDATVMVADIP